MMNLLTFTPVYAGLFALLLLFLAWRVTRYRQSEKINFGLDGSIGFRRAVRAQANALEYVPLGLILLLMLELNHLRPWLFHALALCLLLGRVMHAWGLSRTEGYSHGRFFGTVLTWLSILLMALINIAIVATR